MAKLGDTIDKRFFARDARALFREAARHHRDGRLDEAERFYGRVLAVEPRHAEALHLLGALKYQAGRYVEAAGLMEQATVVRADSPAYHNDLGLALQAQGKLDEAIARFRRALALRPDFSVARNNLGTALFSLGQVDDAAVHFEAALTTAPNHIAARINLGNVLSAQGKFDEAVSQFERALALDGRAADAHFNLGVARMWQNRLDEAFAAYRRHNELRLRNRSSGGVDGRAPRETLPPSRIRHDCEQLDYLLAIHPERDDLRQLKPIAARAPDEFAARFATSFHLEGGERCAPSAINGHLNCSQIERQWNQSRPKVVVVDDLLTRAALDELRRFCLGSTVWRATYPNGYLGAFFADGFACPLLAQIADELRVMLAGVIRNRPLRQLWGFKYDSECDGITVHADVAAVNVNFWITPDEANLDHEHGGLVVWDVPAPLDWPFKKFQNNDASEIRSYLADRRADAITVPYRSNRAVIFDSDLFHETDRFQFKEGYVNRRINITMLYGVRHSGREL